MAKSKVKYPELNAQGMPNGKYTFCSVNPETCQKHAHTNADPLARLKKEQAIALEKTDAIEKKKEKIKEESESLDEMFYNDFDEEDIYPRLGLPTPVAVDAETANAFMEEKIKKVLPLPEVKDENGFFQSPLSQSGVVKCKECGGDLQLVELKNGMKTWHHPNHAELDTISDVTISKDWLQTKTSISADPDWIDEKDIERIKLNAGIGASVGYTWRGPHLFEFARADANGQTSEEYNSSNHETAPADWCARCGSQAGFKETTNRIGSFFSRRDESKTACINCGKDKFGRS